jgi:hypothetical protein
MAMPVEEGLGLVRGVRRSGAVARGGGDRADQYGRRQPHFPTYGRNRRHQPRHPGSLGRGPWAAGFPVVPGWSLTAWQAMQAWGSTYTPTVVFWNERRTQSLSVSLSVLYSDLRVAQCLAYVATGRPASELHYPMWSTKRACRA